MTADELRLSSQQLLAELYPTIDVNPGSAVHDLVLRPFAELTAAGYTQCETVEDNASISEVLAADSPDSDLVDSLLSNIGVAVPEASPATGEIQVIVTRAINTPFSSGNQLLIGTVAVYPRYTYIGVASLTGLTDTSTTRYVQYTALANGTYVFNIEAITEGNFVGTIAQGAVVTNSVNNSNIVAMTTATTFVGAPPETSLEVLRRAVVGVNSRVLTGRQNIASFLQNNAIDVNVTGANVFGMGDVELLRDQTNGIGQGGAVDAYVRVNAAPTIRRVLVTAADAGTGYRSFSLDDSVAPGAAGVLALQSYTGEIITDYSTTPSWISETDIPIGSLPVHYRYSVYQELDITFVYSGEQTLFYADVIFTESLTELQTLVSQPDTRSRAFDILVKSAIPVIVSAQVTIQYPTGVTAPDTDAVAEAVVDAINSLPVGSRRLNASVLVSAVTALNDEYTVLSPLQLSGLIILPDGRNAYDGSQNYLQAPDLDGISSRNCMFATYPSYITVIAQEVGV